MADITTAFVKQFGANVMHLVQQKGSRLRGTVMVEGGVVGEEAYFDQLGTDTAVKKAARNADTVLSDPNHQRRRVTMFDYVHAKLLDKQDKLKMLQDPTNPYAVSGMWALGRAMDDEIIAAATGNSYSGKAGATTETLPSTQKVVHGSTGMNVAKLLAAKEILDANDTDPDEERYCIVTAGQVADLLNATEVKSADYNTVKALAEGKIDSFAGFQFKRTQRLGTDTDSNRQVLCYQKSGIVLAIAQDIMSDIGPRRDKDNAIQVYVSLGIGAIRLEEEKVVEVACTE